MALTRSSIYGFEPMLEPLMPPRYQPFTTGAGGGVVPGFIDRYPLTADGNSTTGNNNGTVTGATFVSDPTRGDVIEYDGSGDRVENTNDMNGYTDFSVYIWAEQDSSGNASTNNIFQSESLLIRHATGGINILVFDNRNGTGPFRTATVTMADDVWKYITVTGAGNTIKVYIDGVDQSASFGTSTTTTVFSGGVLGAAFLSGSYQRHWYGRQSDCIIYDAEHNQDQVTQNYNETVAA